MGKVRRLTHDLAQSVYDLTQSIRDQAFARSLYGRALSLHDLGQGHTRPFKERARSFRLGPTPHCPPLH